MTSLPRHINELIEAMSSFPGLGRKSSRRIVFHLLSESKATTLKLSNALQQLHEKTFFCRICGSISDSETCSICENPSRDRNVICVVENFIDQIVLESTNFYNGLYHVLGGVLSPLDGLGPEKLNVDKLMKRIGKMEIKEIIIASNPTPEGNATALYLADLLDKTGIKISRLARGIPVGGDLDLLDLETIRLSLEGRIEIKKNKLTNSVF